MKKSITLATTIALAAVIGTTASADTINGIQVVSNDGHTIVLANGQKAHIDNNKVYMDYIGEVVLSPDVKPVDIPNQQDPTNKVPTQTVEQGIPTPTQQTPDTPKVPTTPNQQVPTKTPNTPVKPADPKIPNTPNQQVPTKTPTDPKIPTDVTVTVPIKQYPQDNNGTTLPTQTDESHTTTIEDNTHGNTNNGGTNGNTGTGGVTKPGSSKSDNDIHGTGDTKPGAGNKSDSGKSSTNSGKINTGAKTGNSVRTNESKSGNTVAVKSAVKYDNKVKAASAVPTLATMNTLPQTGDEDIDTYLTILAGLLIIVVAGTILYASRRAIKRD